MKYSVKIENGKSEAFDILNYLSENGYDVDYNVLNDVENGKYLKFEKNEIPYISNFRENEIELKFDVSPKNKVVDVNTVKNSIYIIDLECVTEYDLSELHSLFDKLKMSCVSAYNQNSHEPSKFLVICEKTNKFGYFSDLDNFNCMDLIRIFPLKFENIIETPFMSKFIKDMRDIFWPPQKPKDVTFKGCHCFFNSNHSLYTEKNEIVNADDNVQGIMVLNEKFKTIKNNKNFQISTDSLKLAREIIKRGWLS